MPQGKNRSVDASRFAMVPRNDVPRSAFDVITTHKTTFDAGYLIPVYVDEVLPGDSFRVRMTAFARLATPIVPLMDNLYLESFFFFVPNRLVWDNWTRFMGEQLSPTDTTAFMTPQTTIDANQVVTATVADYFGICHMGLGSGAALSVLAFPFRGLNLIWNEWFRDQDLQDPVVVDKDDGPDAYSDYGTLLKRGKRHDYFTSARPWPQKPINMGFPGPEGGPFEPGGRMLFPQSGAPVTGIGIWTGSAQTPFAGPLDIKDSGGRIHSIAPYYKTEVADSIVIDVAGGTYPDIRVLINDIRTANSVQRLMEQSARGGTRYTEIVRSIFGVVSPDARLQRTEYLGGGRAPIVINPIAQTSASEPGGTVLGEQAGIGTMVAHNHGFSQSFTEHGTIIGLVSVRADMTYQQGINRMWFRRTVHDFYWPPLAHLGEQAILSREIYADGSAADATVFGYQERWSEYKFKPGRVSGRFRSTAPQPLDVWHLAQVFGSPTVPVRPVLNDIFIIEDPPVDRVLQVGGLENEQFLFDSVFDIRMVRPMPMFSIPGLGPRL